MAKLLKFIFCSILFPSWLLSMQHVIPALNEIVAHANTQISLQRLHTIARLTKQAQTTIGIKECNMCPVLLTSRVASHNHSASYSVALKKIQIFSLNRPFSLLQYNFFHESAHRLQDVRSPEIVLLALKSLSTRAALEHEADMYTLAHVNCPQCIDEITQHFKQMGQHANIVRKRSGNLTIEELNMAKDRCNCNSLCEYHCQIRRILYEAHQMISHILQKNGIPDSVVMLKTNIMNDQIIAITLTHNSIYFT